MRTIRRILVAVADPSAHSQPALDKAVALARRTGAEIDLFHSLYNPYVQGERLYGTRGMSADIEMLVQVTRERLELRAKRAAPAGLPVRTSVRWDYPPYEGIVRQALRHEADLVVAASERHRAAARFFLTNTDWQLIRLCPVPLLLVKSARPWASAPVLAAIDPLHAHAKPAALDEEILKTAELLSRVFRSHLHALHAYPPAITFAAGPMTEPLPVVTTGIEARRYTSSIRRRVTTLTARHRISKRRTHVSLGDPVEFIPEFARRLNAQVVVMGAVSRSGLKRLFIGNTAERVIDDLNCDVCIVKPPTFRTPVPVRPAHLPMLLPAI